MTGAPSPWADGVLATHSVVSTIPFFVPTFVVVIVIGVLIWRDRRRDDDGNGHDQPRHEDRPSQQG